ncbi:hypothetical protein CDAR_277541 [Caerostris darwini]|uniref:Uncharacterized protein n=1 Tax=Caerostris darwini TaxID=1538125 RepID=A0AAV4VSF3_9ARAC|nr:hypothetical protein CDAR_277541 [Caerostris darwini]
MDVDCKSRLHKHRWMLIVNPDCMVIFKSLVPVVTLKRARGSFVLARVRSGKGWAWVAITTTENRCYWANCYFKVRTYPRKPFAAVDTGRISSVSPPDFKVRGASSPRISRLVCFLQKIRILRVLRTLLKIDGRNV